MVSETDEIAEVFCISPSPPPSATGSDLSPARATPPAFASPSERYEDGAAAFKIGQDVYAFERVTPQQWEIQRVCDSKTADGAWLYPFVSINLPRRSGKTASTYGLAFGRCLEIPGYRVAITMATTGTKLSQLFKNGIFDLLDRHAERTGRPVKNVLSNGHESVKFDNGSVLVLLPPRESAFRSEAFDLVLIDEAGEADADASAYLIQAALPTLDTTGGQLIVAGTPPLSRAGNILHEWQTKAMEGTDPDHGAVFYGIAADLTVEDVETWEQAEPLVERSHPGVSSGLVVGGMAVMRRAYNVMGPKRFAREYLGQAGRDATVAGVINPGKWAEADAGTALPDLPDYFAVAFAVGMGDTFASVVAAWRDDDGRAVLALLEHKPGSAWLPDMIGERVGLPKYKRIPFGCDAKGTAAVEAAKVERAHSRVKIQRMPWAKVQQAAALTVREIHTNNAVHFGQEPLTDAALIASRRGEDKAFAFGRPESNAQISAIEAASIALQLFDETPKRRSMRTMVSTA